MSIACPNCGTANRATARFCAACGTTIQVADEPPASPPPPVSPPPTASPPPPAAAQTPLVVAPPPAQVDESSLPVADRPTAAMPLLPKESDPSDSSPAGQPTKPLPPGPLTLLPEGAFLSSPHKEFTIQRGSTVNAHLNEYGVMEVVGSHICPVCSYTNNALDESYCNQCGSDLTNVPITQMTYTIRESDQPELFEVEGQLAQLGLSEPTLRLPGPVFSHRVGGATRTYLVLPSPPLAWIANSPVPQEVHQVLDWGSALLKGLSALHQNQVAFGQNFGQRIALEGDRISWADFSGCVIPGQPRQFAAEVRELVQWLYYLMTGQQQYSPSVELPATIQALFQQILTTDKPVPGAAELAGILEQGLAEIRRPFSIDFRVGRLSDVGMERQLNEDSMMTLGIVWNNKSVSQPIGVYVVADGMGGHASGEVASGLTLKAIAKATVQELFLPTTGGGGEIPDYTAWVKHAANVANTAVHNEVIATGNDMGTTLVVALVVGDQVHIANVGDSRVYLVNADEIRQLTVDHSLVERLIATNQITREEARHHPQRNVIYRTIGDKGKVEADTTTAHLAPGDRLLLCSDGLSGMVDDEDMHSLVLMSTSPQEACERLIKAANAAGGEDNITAVIVQVEAVQ